MRLNLKKLFWPRYFEAYDSIHRMPMYNWKQIRALNDVSFIMKDDRWHGKDLPLTDIKKLNDKLWDLNQEYLDEFGIGKNQKFLLDLKLDFIRKSSKAITSRNPFDRQMAIIARDMMNFEKSKIVTQHIDENIANVESILNVPLNLRNLSVVEYEYRARLASDKVEAAKKKYG